MSRVKLVANEEAPRLIQRMFGQMEKLFGAVPNSSRALAQVPGLVGSVAGLGKIETHEGDLPKSLKFLAKLRVAHRNQCAFCIDIGHARAGDHGITPEQLEALSYDDAKERLGWTPEECLVLDYTDALADTMTVSEKLFAQMRESFSEPQIVELTAQIAAETFYNVFNRALGIEAQGFRSFEQPSVVGE